jgi:catechol 2,3-dioxygenase-like lactoylglutathione lyase family enzyme
MAETQSSTRISAVGRVVLPVTDQDRALDFYVGKLGFEKRVDVPFGDGDRWIEVAPAGATTTIAIVPGREETAPGTQSRIILDTDDIDGVHADLRDRGVEVDEQVARMGDPVPPMFWFRDQDSNVLMVVQPQA